MGVGWKPDKYATNHAAPFQDHRTRVRFNHAEFCMNIVDLVAGSIVKAGSGNRAAVRAIQAALGINIDGDFGDGTEKAVEQFQRAHNLKADGEVGHMTATDRKSVM